MASKTCACCAHERELSSSLSTPSEPASRELKVCAYCRARQTESNRKRKAPQPLDLSILARERRLLECLDPSRPGPSNRLPMLPPELPLLPLQIAYKTCSACAHERELSSFLSNPSEPASRELKPVRTVRRVQQSQPGRERHHSLWILAFRPRSDVPLKVLNTGTRLDLDYQ